MKVILIKNAVETLGYFSEQLAETFQEMGHDTYFVDYDDLVNTVDGISRFAVPEKTVLCTFNFIGLSGEEVFIEENGRYIWENQGIACINILCGSSTVLSFKTGKASGAGNACFLY